MNTETQALKKEDCLYLNLLMLFGGGLGPLP